MLAQSHALIQMLAEAQMGVEATAAEVTIFLQLAQATAYTFMTNMPTSKALLPQAAAAILADVQSKVRATIFKPLVCDFLLCLMLFL
jgi:hypothetical protein